MGSFPLELWKKSSGYWWLHCPARRVRAGSARSSDPQYVLSELQKQSLEAGGQTEEN